MTVLGIGEAPLDTTYQIPGFLQENQKHPASDITHSVGGPVPAALILLSRLGADCTLVTQLGTDVEGELVERTLRKEKLRLVIHRAKKTKHHTYLVNEGNGSRTGIKSPVSHNHLDEVPQELLKEVSLVLFDRHEPLAFKSVIKQVNPGTIVLLDPSTDDSLTTLKHTRQTTLPILPVELIKKTCPRLTLKQALATWQQLLEKPFIVTLGEHGCLLHDRPGYTHFPPLSIRAVDTLGAGDIFRAGVAYGLLQNWALAQTLNFANLVAGIQCLKKGNSAAIPRKLQIRKLQQTVHYRPISSGQLNSWYNTYLHQ